MNSHQETFLELGELGTRLPKYRPTFDFEGEYIDKSHRLFSECPVKDESLIQIQEPQSGSIIEGWLRREDALKLYEMAYFSSGDILELGSYKGLSTCILSRANQNSPVTKSIYSVDLSSECVESTKRNLEAMGLAAGVTTVCDDALSVVKRFTEERKTFEFVFIDHSHAYQPVHEVCCQMRKIVPKGGFCLFHDFNDPRNRDPNNRDYGVYSAVMDGLSEYEFAFYGIYGCTALYRAI